MRSVRPCIIALSLLVLNIDLALAYDERHLDQMKTLGACSKCDLSKSNLPKVNLKEANLEKADISKSILRHGDFTSANLVKASLRNQI